LSKLGPHYDEAITALSRDLLPSLAR
jgi:hypothetical protein